MQVGSVARGGAGGEPGYSDWGEYGYPEWGEEEEERGQKMDQLMRSKDPNATTARVSGILHESVL